VGWRVGSLVAQPLVEGELIKDSDRRCQCENVRSVDTYNVCMYSTYIQRYIVWYVPVYYILYGWQI